jgi:hypothetical protein
MIAIIEQKMLLNVDSAGERELLYFRLANEKEVMKKKREVRERF